MHNEDNLKKKKFKLFDTQREGKGVSREEANLPPGFKKFFILYKRDFFRLLSVNVLTILGNFPAIFLLLGISGIFSLNFATHSASAYTLFSGIMTQEGVTAPMLALNGIIGAPVMDSVATVTTYVLIGIGALTLFTFGIVNVGTTYVLRNMIKGDPVFVWSDFWYAVRRNLKQALIYGIFDLILIVLIPYNIVFYSQRTGFVNGLFFWLCIVVGFIYLMMRCYIYIQMLTFDLSIKKILKNSLIFAFIGFKRLILAFLGCILLIFFTFMLASVSSLLPVAILIPLAMLFSNCAYMTTYAAYFKIKEVMIDPYDAKVAAAENGDVAAN